MRDSRQLYYHGYGSNLDPLRSALCALKSSDKRRLDAAEGAGRGRTRCCSPA
ncbi:hypothetical protein [Thioalkalivibrio sp. XN8]|uniref:hypothetical protein n=1 Tax=Thioalkalivibrio sp. XN8 TaxID=2712863 RepID=UPI0013EC54F1|nr:hypothetical protein [Thioalkalivibrio sp. XN8]NGP53516.1 hypothetical protein [Thioalkalivibrio sp. XN8]